MLALIPIWKLALNLVLVTIVLVAGLWLFKKVMNLLKGKKR
jgi:hypothetical protein